MQTEHAACVSWTRTIVAISLLLSGSYPALGQAPASNATGRREAQTPAGVSVAGSRRLPADVEQAIRWLPEDTETIIVVRGPLKETPVEKPPVKDPVVKEPVDPTRPYLPALPQSPQAALDFHQLSLEDWTWTFGVAGDAFVQNVVKQRIRFVVAAGRHFGPPVIGGRSTFEGCQLILFDNDVPDVGVQPANGEKVGVEQIEYNRVVRVDTNWGRQEEKLSVYYAKPKPAILIAATDIRFVKTMLNRIGHPPASRTPLLGFPEWEYVDTTAPVWGIRHRRTAKPFYILAAPSKEGFPFSELSGVTFSYQPQPTTSVTLRFHFTEKAEGILPRVIGKEADAGQISKLISPLVAERKVAIREQSVPGEGNPFTPLDMSLMLHHLMGYVICP